MPDSQNPQELAALVSTALRQIEDTLPRDERVHIYVPAGVVRTVRQIRPEYFFISDTTIRRNICYGVEALDYYRWMINRFRLYGPVSGYLYKTGIILIDAIVEAITRDFLDQKRVALAKKHSVNIRKLEQCGISSALCERICALHERRANIHLHLVTDLEATKYNLEDWNRSMRCLHTIKETFPRVLYG